MSIRWRKNPDGKHKTAYLDITIPGCERIRCSTGIRSDMPNARQLAQELHDTRRTELWRQAKLGDKPRRLWQEAVVKWIGEHHHKRSLPGDKTILRWLDPHLRNQFLDAIDREMIDRIMAIKESEGVSPATVNRYSALLRSILICAHKEWEWIDAVPKVRMRRENSGRIRWLTREQADRLLAELDRSAPHVADAAEFTLNTGLRDANVCRLMWHQIDMDLATMRVYQTKNGRPLGTPLNQDAIAILQRRADIHSDYVFTWRGEPVTRFNNSAFRKACKRAGLEDFRWHDLRHTWASWMVQGGCPLEVLQKLGGWQTLEMVLRYAHLSTEHLAQYSSISSRETPRLRVVK